MQSFRADLHTHTVLSPCGNLEMSPANIIRRAKEQHIDILGITDHNTTYHCALCKELGEREGIFVLTGVEVTTREDVHCLAFFEDATSLNTFQEYIALNLPFIKNKPERLGYQVVVDEQENIIGELDGYLGVGLNQSIDQIRAKVRDIGGIFIPAHVDRPRYGVISQLGFLPPELDPDAIEIFGIRSRDEFLNQRPELLKYTLTKSSDSHFLDQIGKRYTTFTLEAPTFQEIRKALRNEDGRKTEIV